jgi:hypothetical protein
VRGAERQHARAHAAEVERVLAVEEDVGLAELDVLEQVRHTRRSARERLGQRQTEFVDVFLLRLCANDFRGRGKRGLAECVLGMDVRTHDVEVCILTHAIRGVKHGLAVARAQSGVDHQRRFGADDDADVRDEADVEIRDHVNVVGYLRDRAFLDQRVSRWLLRGYYGADARSHDQRGDLRRQMSL